jgi:HlyD family secretion protein
MARRSKVRRTVRYTIYGLLLAGFVGAIALASQSKPVIVDLAEVTKGRVEVTVEDAGRTRVTDRYTVSAPMSGSLARITLSPGDAVEEDGIVAHLNAMETGLLDPRSKSQAEASLAAAVATQAKLRAEVSRAEASTQFAESERARIEALAASGGMSQREADRTRYEAQSAREGLASARFSVRVADHEVRLARAALTRGRVSEVLPLRSPVDGVVLRVFEESAGVVQAGQALLEIGDPSRLEVVVDVLTTEAVSIKPGHPAALVRWGGGDTLHGRVRVIEPSAFTKRSALGVEEQRVNVIIELLDPPEARAGLADGYRIEAKIEVAAAEDVVRVPASALFRDGDDWATYVVRDGLASRAQVELGLRGTDVVEVRNGLSVGDRVIVHPGSAISDGVKVTDRR